jgi:predicted kinase
MVAHRERCLWIGRKRSFAPLSHPDDMSDAIPSSDLHRNPTGSTRRRRIRRRAAPDRFPARKRQLTQPCLILLLGVAGSGKSTLARETIRRICAVYLDNNHIADAFFPDTRHSFAYQQSRPRFYKALYTITEENLRLGNSVLLDVPHIKEVQTRKWRDFIKRLVRRTKTKLVVVRCVCSEKTLHSRIRSRGLKRDRWKLENWSEFLRTQPIKVPIPFAHLDINTENNLVRSINAAVRHILRQVGRPPS